MFNQEYKQIPLNSEQYLELKFSNIDFEHSILKTPKIIIHQINLLDIDAQKIYNLYNKYNIFLPKHVTKASIKRKCEFFLGRLAAKYALNDLGNYSSFIIERGKQGEPLWPDQITGSISHSMLDCTQGIAIAATSRLNKNMNDLKELSKIYNQTASLSGQFLGIDIEIKKNSEIFDRNPSILTNIFSFQEIKLISPFLKQRPVLHLIIFSAKESLIKVVYNKYKKIISFDTMHCINICEQTQTFMFYIPQISNNEKFLVNYIELDYQILTYCCLKS